MNINDSMLVLTDSISTQIKYYIRDNNTTLDKLAGDLEMSGMVLAQIIYENKVPTLRELLEIARGLGMKVTITLEEL